MRRKELLALIHMLKEKREKLLEDGMEFSASVIEYEICKIQTMVKEIDGGGPDKEI